MSLVDEIMTALMKIAQQTGEGPVEVALPTKSYLQLAFELGRAAAIRRHQKGL